MTDRPHIPPDIEKYLDQRLGALSPIFAKASIGDFSEDVVLPPEDDAFAETYAGVQIMLDVIREKIADLEKSNIELGSNVDQLEVLTSKIQSEQAQDEAMLMAVGDALVVIDAQAKVVLVNSVFEQMTGWTAKDAFGKPIYEVLPAENEQGQHISNEQRPYTEVLVKGKTVKTRLENEPYYYVRRDGSRFPVAITVTPMIMNKHIVGTVNVFRDITHEMDIDRAKSEFVSLASHELRTPLTIIRWSIDMLQKYTGSLTDAQAKYVRAIEQTGSEMVDLVDALLNVSRIEMGTLSIEPEPTQLNTLISLIAKELQPLLDKKKLHLAVNLESTLPEINLDAKLVRVVITNLLTNAIKYTPVDGHITIESSIKNQDVVVSVRDTGMGIPKKDQIKIFQKMFRADNVRENEPHGTGLGLYIAKAVIERSEGKIWFTSVENQGSTFNFSLPLSGMPAKAGTKTLEIKELTTKPPKR